MNKMNEENEQIQRAIRLIMDTTRCPNCEKGKGESLEIEKAEYIPHLATVRLTIKCLNCNYTYEAFFLDEVLLRAMWLEEQKQKEEKEK
jgi:rubredoxin